uniref:hypothetical protein n=1 Tax=unclassified Streptomyces TaxID=2593676 RepID=UPI003C7B86A2
MSRDAEVIVLARWSDEVMEPLTQDDPERTWRGRFVPIAGQWGYQFGWALEFEKLRGRQGLLGHLESLPWPHPHTVQVLLRDQDDDCFGLWMFQEGRLVEVTWTATARSSTGPIDRLCRVAWWGPKFRASSKARMLTVGPVSR